MKSSSAILARGYLLIHPSSTWATPGPVMIPKMGIGHDGKMLFRDVFLSRHRLDDLVNLGVIVVNRRATRLLGPVGIPIHVSVLSSFDSGVHP